eukprot:347701-Chlamydomonas_euryale.AAC.22
MGFTSMLQLFGTGVDRGCSESHSDAAETAACNPASCHQRHHTTLSHYMSKTTFNKQIQSREIGNAVAIPTWPCVTAHSATFLTETQPHQLNKATSCDRKPRQRRLHFHWRTASSRRHAPWMGSASRRYAHEPTRRHPHDPRATDHSNGSLIRALTGGWSGRLGKGLGPDGGGPWCRRWGMPRSSVVLTPRCGR